MVGQVLSAPINFKMDFCACKDGLPISFGNCESFCAEAQTNGAEILYSSFTLKPHPVLNTVHKWCNNVRPRRVVNPKCVMKAVKGNGTVITMDIEFRSENAISINVDRLLNDTTYLLQLFEVSSGAKSDKIQFVKFKN
jgi:hypothetical protein